MTRAVAALAMPWLATLVWLRCQPVRRLSWIVAVSAAAGLGLGLASVCWWFFVHLPIHDTRWFLAADFTIWMLATCAAFLWRPPGWPVESARVRAVPRWSMWATVALCVGFAALAAVLFVAAIVVQPHGSGDAWAIWNERARFLFRAGPVDWRDVFIASAGNAHSDYPLLLPLAVLRMWTAGGREMLATPAVIAAMFTCATIGLAAGSVARASGRVYGLVTAAIILACPTFMRMAPAETADIPLAFYMLASFVMAGLAMGDERYARLWTAAGAFAGLAAWTKNEGLVFLIAFFVVTGAWAVMTRRRGARAILTRAAAGALPMIAALLLFHADDGATSEYVKAIVSPELFARMTDPRRFEMIGLAMGREFWSGGGTRIGPLPVLLVFVSLTGVRRSATRAPLLALASVALVLAAHAIVYAITPYDLGWQLSTSADRVVLHVFPTLVWSGVMLARPLFGEAVHDPSARSA